MKKPLIITIIVIVVIIAGWFVFRFVIGGDEDTWICENGQWVKHGNPSQQYPPTTGCGTNVNGQANVNSIEEKKPSDSQQYNWSTMSQGPYRDKISYAKSTDLLTWTDSKKTLAEHASVPGAIVKSGEIFMYFVDVSQDGIAERLGLIRSTDNGATWSAKQFVTITGVGDRVPVDPAPFLLDDGRIRMYYFDIDAGRTGQAVPNTIYSAISSDGVNFTQQEGKRFEGQNIFDPDVVKVGDTWRLYVGDPEGKGVYSATSTDGLTFTPEGKAYTGGVVPDVWYENNIYYLFVAGIDIATSQDGKTFTKTQNRFQSSLAQLTADPSVIKLGDGSYMMFYKYKE